MRRDGECEAQDRVDCGEGIRPPTLEVDDDREDDLESGDDEEVRQPEGPTAPDQGSTSPSRRRSTVAPAARYESDPGAVPWGSRVQGGAEPKEGRRRRVSRHPPPRRQQWPRTGPILHHCGWSLARSIASSSWRERSRATPPESVRLTALPARAPSLRGAASAVETVSAIAAATGGADRARTKRCTETCWGPFALCRCRDQGMSWRSMGGGADVTAERCRSRSAAPRNPRDGSRDHPKVPWRHAVRPPAASRSCAAWRWRSSIVVFA